MTLTDAAAASGRTSALAERLVRLDHCRARVVQHSARRELGLYDVRADWPGTADELAAQARCAHLSRHVIESFQMTESKELDRSETMCRNSGGVQSAASGSVDRASSSPT